MQIKLPTTDQTNAFARHVVSYGAGAASMLAALHLITAGDATAAADALNHMGHAVSEFVAAAATLIAIGSGLIASLSASPLVQLLKGATAVANNPSLGKQASVTTQVAVSAAAIEMPQIHNVVADAEVADKAPNAVVTPDKVTVKS